MPYKILTDSSCDLGREKCSELGVDIIPLTFLMGDKDYRDYFAEDMSAPEFYARVRAGEMPMTSMVNEQSFVEFFTPYLKEGIDIVYIGFSSALSGTWQSAANAAEMLKAAYPERKIFTLDSRCASLGQGLLVSYACAKRDEGLSADDLAQWIEQNRLKFVHWFTVDDINHLYRGGRVSRMTAMLGTVLKIKPVMHVDNLGRLIPMEKVIGRKKALARLADKIAACCIEKSPHIFISHGDCMDDVELLTAMLKERLTLSELYVNYVGPVIGTHSGPGTMAVFCYGSVR